MPLLLSRLASAAVVIFGVLVLVFLLIHLVPGDPVEVMLGESAQAADREALRQSLGLDQPLLTQFATYLSTSLHTKRPIADILLERLPATIELTLAALLVAVLIAFPLGVMAAVRKDSAWDHSAMASIISRMVRSTVERVFGVLKQHYALGKARYLGLGRNRTRFEIMCVAHNIKRGLSIQQASRA